MNKSTSNLIINTSCLDNILIDNFTVTLFNETFTQVFTNFSTPANILQDINVSDFGNDVYTLNLTCFDNSSNSQTLFHEITISDLLLQSVELVSPDNNSVITNTNFFNLEGEGEFVYSVTSAGTCSLILNGSIVQTQSATAGTNTFVEIFNTNADFQWEVTCNVSNNIIINSSFFIITTDLSLVEEAYSLATCPNTDLTNMLFFALIIGLGFGIFLLGIGVQIPALSFLGGSLLLIMSFFLYSCIIFLFLVVSFL